MPRFRVRLEQPGTDEFRVTYLNAPDADAAAAWCEERERKFCAFRLTKPNPDYRFDAEAGEWVGEPELELIADEVAEAEADPTSPVNKAQRLLHEQAEPYEVVSVELRGERTSETKAKRLKKAGD